MSGGQYDKLMRRMEKRSGAIGFAVYLDQLEGLDCSQRDFDIDTVLLYDGTASPSAVQRAVGAITEQGESVVALKALPERLKYRRLLRLTEGGVETLEANA